ncbi:hypothetical protein [Streptomyces silaceus]|uniref:hypothetical protein n=1 Tax=Streptomyces silaceus TaxID=545123 RepID=UPI0006EB2F34|nr:hypothetical protein [Streptomyces silaceus]
MKSLLRVSAPRLALIFGILFLIACPSAFRLAVEALLQVLPIAVAVLAWLLIAGVEVAVWLLTTPTGAALLGIAAAAALLRWAVTQLRHGVQLGWGRA